MKNQTKKAIQPLYPAGHDGVFKKRLTTYLIENKRRCGQDRPSVLINNARARNAEENPSNIKTNLQQKTDMANRVQVHRLCRSKDKARRDIHRRGRLGGGRHPRVMPSSRASCLFEARS